MSNNFAQGVYQVKNPKKYVGKGSPRYRSGWEWAFFQFCDNNDAVLEWASEAIAIKYLHPLTGKMANYIPDVFMRYQTRNDKICTELIEIKPKNQSMITEKMKDRDRAVVAINHAKWAAAQAWCKRAGIVFRVITEDQMFHNGSKKR
jgi:TnsA endonuclease N terminal